MVALHPSKEHDSDVWLENLVNLPNQGYDLGTVQRPGPIQVVDVELPRDELKSTVSPAPFSPMQTVLLLGILVIAAAASHPDIGLQTALHQLPIAERNIRTNLVSLSTPLQKQTIPNLQDIIALAHPAAVSLTTVVTTVLISIMPTTWLEIVLLTLRTVIAIMRISNRQRQCPPIRTSIPLLLKSRFSTLTSTAPPTMRRHLHNRVNLL